ncbi:caax amino protease family protein [Streptococcus pneumoniae]|nr:caax amino protease family protein [Streptococcus pneumoniae]VIT35316.1 caax amino protease family protein [Streptococcus pneumoniae]VJC01189.1 caax amino protease family protein [Streptococcus pneumoniae]VJO17432.1 caax amino protease family protein [Streptococcus pneumoniae]VJS06455.1 caax amino protease family protein [Streptococcus pneumoniae]
MLGSTASEQGNLSKKYDEKHKETKTIWNILLIILLSTYLPQTIGLYVTIILGLGADVYSLILTVGLVGSFLFY